MIDIDWLWLTIKQSPWPGNIPIDPPRSLAWTTSAASQGVEPRSMFSAPTSGFFEGRKIHGDGMLWLIWGRFSTWNVQFLVDFYFKNLKNWWKIITWNPISQASWLSFSWVWVKSMIFAVSSVQKSRFDMISPIQTIDLVTKNGGGWQNHGIWNWMTRWQMNILLRLLKKTRHKGSLESQGCSVPNL
jgi:hypothetical protein